MSSIGVLKLFGNVTSLPLSNSSIFDTIFMYLLSFIAFFLLRFFVFDDLKLDGFPFIKFIRRCISLRDGGERLADASTEPSTILNLSGLYVLASSRKPSLNILINAKFKISSFGSFLFILGRDRRRCRDAGDSFVVGVERERLGVLSVSLL